MAGLVTQVGARVLRTNIAPTRITQLGARVVRQYFPDVSSAPRRRQPCLIG